MKALQRSTAVGRAGRRRRSWGARVLSGTLVAIIAAGVLGIGALAVAQGTGKVRLAPVLSGSMAPEIDQGDLVVAEPIDKRDLRAGDILVFQAPIKGNPAVVHRISAVSEIRGEPAFHTKGDANEAPDVWTIRVKGSVAWRVTRVVPGVGSTIGWLHRADLRMIVLIAGALIFMIWSLRAVWSLRPISWRADDPYGVRRRRQTRRSTRRAAVFVTVGLLGVTVLAAVGAAAAQFTGTPAPPVPGFTSGTLNAPSPLSCRWASASTLRLDWANTTPGYATGYSIQRANVDGGPYSQIGTASPDTTTTFTDPAPVPPTLRYYVADATRSTWSSPHSNQVVSNACIGAINLVAGTTIGFSGDNSAATSAQLSAPRGVAVDTSGNVYIADTTNNRIRRVDAASGIITTIAGGGVNTACTFTGAATAVSMSAPRGVAVDASGTVYIADTGRNCVRKVIAGTVSQVAGGGVNTACTFAGAATAVSMSSPRGVAVDAAGTVYIADTTRNCIRKVTAGNVSQVAGGGATATCSFSGAASAVLLSAPSGVAVDAGRTVYIADTTNNCIRKVTAGNVSQVAGGGATTACSFSGAASAVSLSGPTGVTIDSAGRVVVTDSTRRCVRLVNGANVSLLAGTGTSGSTGDNGPAVGALMTTPAAVAANASGDVWVADAGNHRVRRVEGPT